MVELHFENDSGMEVDVLRSREMIQRYAGKYGESLFRDPTAGMIFVPRAGNDVVWYVPVLHHHRPSFLE
jgi:hypothetical protein